MIGMLKLFVPMISLFVMTDTTLWYMIDMASVYYISTLIAIKQLCNYAKIYKYPAFEIAILPVIVISIGTFCLAAGVLFQLTRNILFVLLVPFYIITIIGTQVGYFIEYIAGVPIIAMIAVINDTYNIINPLNSIRIIITNYLILYVVIDDIVSYNIVRKAVEINNDEFVTISQDLYDRITPIDDIKIDPPTQIREVKD